jgi:hypothetical protein
VIEIDDVVTDTETIAGTGLTASVWVAAKAVGKAVEYTAFEVVLVAGAVYAMLPLFVGSVKVPAKLSTSPELEQPVIVPPDVAVAESYTKSL